MQTRQNDAKDKIKSEKKIDIIIRECKTRVEIESTYPVMQQLRPNVLFKDYFTRVDSIMKNENYRLFAAYNNQQQCISIVGFQEQNRLSLGKIIYLADLVTLESHRSFGIGSQMLSIVKKEAADNKIETIVLDSGVQRKSAHEFYQRHGYKAESYSFRLHKPFTPAIKIESGAPENDSVNKPPLLSRL